MLDTYQIEELIEIVTSLDRQTLVEQFESYRSNFPLDFTREFLDRLSLDRLQHIFVAICLQTQQLPEIAVDAA